VKPASADSAGRAHELLARLAAVPVAVGPQDDSAVRAKLREAVAEYGVKGN
jgi:hypothetical protein